MVKIGLISDTHSYLDPAVFEHFKQCDEIWHMGDIGNPEVIRKIQQFKPTKAVYGNIDEPEIRYEFPENLFFEMEGLSILITHIGSLPGRHTKRIRDLFKKYKPDLFICGHSHILRVIKEKSYIYINPGAAGNHGFHHTRTIMRMDLADGKIKNMEVIELGRR